MNRSHVIILGIVVLLLSVSGVLVNAPAADDRRLTGISVEAEQTITALQEQVAALSITPLSGFAATAELSATDPTGDAYQLVYSERSDRSDPQPLDDATLTGSVYAYTTPNRGVRTVRFSLDGDVVRHENSPPFDFGGGDDDAADPWSLTDVAEGTHQIEAQLTLDDGSVVTSRATFAVINGEGVSTPSVQIQDPTSTGELTLTTTFNSIGVELRSRNFGTASLRYRTAGSDWFDAFPLWYAGDGYRGSVLFLDDNTTYEIQVDVGGSTFTNSITTWAEDIPAAANLAPTHVVCATCEWTTLDDALAGAPAGAVVMVSSGTFAVPTVKRTDPITLVAEFPAVSDMGEEINAGQRSVIQPAATTKPGDSAWQLVTLTGPVSNQSFTLWRWTAPAQVNRLAYETPTGLQRVAAWDNKRGDRGGYTMETPAGFAEILFENLDYNYGFQSFGNDVYARFPDDIDPNKVIVLGGTDRSYTTDASGVRFSGFELQLTGLGFDAPASGGIIDHNLILDAEVYYRAAQPSTYPTRHVIERNIFRASGIWDDQPTTPGALIPWNFIKGTLPLPGGVDGWGRMGDDAETAAIWGRGGPNQLVVRYNTIEGYFNGIGGQNADFDSNSWRDTDIHDNRIRRIADDAFEPERNIINWRVWNNQIDNVTVVISTGPTHFGPVYLVGNQARELGNHGAGQDNDGDVGAKGRAFKFSGSSNPPALIVVVGNAFIARDGVPLGGGGQSANGGRSTEVFYLRNNLFVMSQYAFEYPGAWDEDYNQWYTSDLERGLRRYLTIAEYRAAEDDGDSSNPAGDIHDRVSEDDPRLVDAGVVVPNLDTTYLGAAPDVGALER